MSPAAVCLVPQMQIEVIYIEHQHLPTTLEQMKQRQLHQVGVKEVLPAPPGAASGTGESEAGRGKGQAAGGLTRSMLRFHQRIPGRSLDKIRSPGVSCTLTGH